MNEELLIFILSRELNEAKKCRFYSKELLNYYNEVKKLLELLLRGNYK